ncbi:MAG: hypothetical protein AB1597_07905 [Chloroflexota bacterium]
MKLKILLYLLTVIILSIPSATRPVEAQTTTALRWEALEALGASGNIIVNPSEVSAIAAGSDGTFYAIDIPNSRLYRSWNSGKEWEEITQTLSGAGAAMPATLIATAPDMTGLICAVTDGGTRVYFSGNGGASWTSLFVPALTGTIQAIAMSRKYVEGNTTYVEIAIGTAIWGNATTDGQLYIIRIGNPFATWANQNLTVDGTLVGGEISAIAYSPGYANDRTIAVVASTNGDTAPAFASRTWLCLGTRDTTTGTTTWNTPVTGYPVEVGTVGSPSAGDAPGITRFLSFLDLPSNFSTSAPATLKAFVSYDRQPNANDDVYRIANTTVTRLNANGGAVIDIASLDYSGSATSGKLLAGDRDPIAGTINVQVRWSTDPWSAAPTWLTPTQSPTGPGNARVMWGSGNVAYCGTGQSPATATDESAFSRTSDGGDTWEQVSLIDTRIIFLDIAIAASPRSVFVTTTNGLGIESVWRAAGEPFGRYWERIYTFNAASNQVIVRLSPGYATDYTLYIAEVGGTQMAVSYTRGNTWRLRWTPGVVVDIAVAGKDLLYAGLPGGMVARSNAGAMYWEPSILTGLAAINMLTLTPDGSALLVGGRSGDAAYSVDGGKSFTVMEPVGTGLVQMTADSNYTTNRTIYAGEGNRILRTVLGSDQAWTTIRATTASRRFTGLTSIDGVLYGAWWDSVAAGSGAERSLSPLARQTEWDTLDNGSTTARFDTTPQSLRWLKLTDRLSLWTIDTTAQTIMTFGDTLAEVRPIITVPGINVPTNVPSSPVSGGNQQFTIRWATASESSEYEVEIYADPDLSDLVVSAPVTPPATGYRPPDAGNPAWLIGDGILASGRDYYVRLRVVNEFDNERVKSPWSEPVKFTVMTGVPVTTSQTGSVTTAPTQNALNVSSRPGFTWTSVPGAMKYEVQLAQDASFSRMASGTPAVVSTTAWQPSDDLSPDTVYFWRVRAILPAPGEWSQTAVFTTAPAPAPVQTAVNTPTPQPPATVTVQSPPAPDEAVPTPIVYGIIGVLAVMLGGLIVLVVRTRR